MVVVTGQSLNIAAKSRFNEEIAGDRSSEFARRASLEAWTDSRSDAAPERVGSTVTISKLGIEGLVRANDWAGFVAPRLAPDFAQGPVVTSISACATGLSSWARAAALLENDDADTVFAGAAEGALHPFVIAGFERMGVISRTTPRPFDRRRDGFVPAEGWGVVVLERESDARARGANIRGRLLGFAQMSDPHDALVGSPDGAAIVRLMEKALRTADIAMRDISYIHLHGTGTIPNDRTEAAALRKLCDAKGIFIPASSTKGATGHCLGASGAVEALLTLEALTSQTAPATMGLEELDDDCRSECIIRDEIKISGRVGLVLSYGFGGHLAAMILDV